jgi:hypothetical protein
VQQDRDVADATAVESLFTRVTGYNHEVEKVFLYRGEPGTATYTAHVPPETRACMFWLRNRRPEDWHGGNCPQFCCLTQGCTPNTAAPNG